MRGGRPSATAHLIARSLVFLSREPRFAPLIPPEAVEASRWFMEAHSRLTPLLMRWIDRPWFRRIVWHSERSGLPGMLLHYAARKLWLEETAREALAAGCRQLVVLGAGYDTLTLRLHRKFPGCFFLEIDHPATQAVKQAALKRRGLPGENMLLLPLDLAREGLAEGVKRASEYRSEVDTLFIAEGLLMYLDAAEVARLLRFCREGGGPRARLAFTWMEREADGRIAFRGQSRLVDGWLALRGEPFRWGIAREELPRYLAGQGFRLVSVASADTFRERYLGAPELQGEPLADGDHGCLAEALPGEPPGGPPPQRPGL